MIEDRIKLALIENLIAAINSIDLAGLPIEKITNLKQKFDELKTDVDEIRDGLIS